MHSESSIASSVYQTSFRSSYDIRLGLGRRDNKRIGNITVWFGWWWGFLFRFFRAKRFTAKTGSFADLIHSLLPILQEPKSLVKIQAWYEEDIWAYHVVANHIVNNVKHVFALMV